MAWFEIEYKTIEDDSGVDWEALGTKPKKGKAIYRRRIVNTYDVEYVDDLSKDECIVKFAWKESAFIVKGNIEDISALILFVEDEGFEDDDESKEDDLVL